MKHSKGLMCFLSMVLVITLTCSSNIIAFAKDEAVENNSILSDFDIEESFTVETSNGSSVDFSITEEAVSAIENEDIDKLVEINSGVEEINIETTDSFLKLDEIPSQVAVVSNDGEIINVTLDSDTVGDITSDEIIDIIESNDVSSFDTVNINEVHEIDYVDDSFVSQMKVEQSSYDITPQWKWYDLWISWTTSRSYGKEYVKKDCFIASAARGETYQLTKKFEDSLSISVEAGAAYDGASAKAGLKNKITYSVEKSHKYSGPAENSKYNTREYRVKFYAKPCTVKQAVKGWPSNHTSNYSVKYIVPTKYASYSIDKKLK